MPVIKLSYQVLTKILIHEIRGKGGRNLYNLYKHLKYCCQPTANSATLLLFTVRKTISLLRLKIALAFNK